MSDDRLKRTLQSEMRQVSFSEDDKRRMAAQLKQAMAARADKASSASGLPPRPHAQARPWAQSQAQRWGALSERATAFWNGTTEISAPAAAAALVLIGLGVWSSLRPLLLIDQSAAALLMQASTEKTTLINQGVSLL
ncbi:MAG TPA: hypothetical protein DDZ84_01665 [Firmicutes bacterium]|nr:hypothetical protein [Bacillota bacterium]